eukprot:6480144-Amphidinium_carterae.1
MKGGKMNKQVAQGELLGRGGRRCCVLKLNITTIWRSKGLRKGSVLNSLSVLNLSADAKKPGMET